MTVERSRVGWGFWLWWVLATTVGWFLGFFVGFVGGYGVEEILPNYGNATVTAGVGAGVGILQWLVLRRRISRAGWWVLASTVALAGGGAVIMPGSFAEPVGWIVAAAVGGAMAGIVQWFVLRRQVSRAGWWVLASTVGWCVSWAVCIGVEDALGPMGFSPLAVSVAAGGIGLGAITGIMLVWLLRQPAPEA